MSSCKFRTGISVVEVLIYLFLLVAFIALILSFDRARTSNNASLCLSNTHQLWRSIQMYANDYDQHYPFADNKGNSWAFSLNMYIKNDGVFRCPASGIRDKNEKGLQFNGHSAPAYATYLYNLHIGGINSSRAQRSDPGVVNLTTAAVSRPSNTVLMADGATTASAKVSPEAWTVKPYSSGIAPLLADSYYSAVVSPEMPGPSAPRALHNRKCTVLYCDGHVKMLPIQSFYNGPGIKVSPTKPQGYSPCLDPQTGCNAN